MPDWYVYLIRCRDGSLYTGIATDVNRRFAEHQARNTVGAKYLRGRGPLTLAFQKKIGDRSLALRVESKIKKLPKVQKEEMIADDYRLSVIIERLQPAAVPVLPSGHNGKQAIHLSL